MTTPAAAATSDRRFRPSPITTGVGDEADLISRYLLDSGSVADNLGGVNGTIVVPWPSTTTSSLVSGVSGQSFWKNGDTAYFTLPANNPTHNLGSLSFSFYFQPSTNAPFMCICARSNSSTPGGFSIERRDSGRLRGWHVGQDGGLRFFANDPTGIPGTNLVVGTAYRITVTMGLGGFKIYLDDDLAAHISENINTWNNSAAWFFGVYTDLSLPMFGALDHIRVWDGELQPSGVAALEPAASISTPTVEGIAGGFTEDVGLSGHSSVLLQDRFETGTFSTLWNRTPIKSPVNADWSRGTVQSGATHAHSGSWGMRNVIPQSTSSEDGGCLWRDFYVNSLAYDTLHVRWYQKLDAGYDDSGANHLGCWIIGCTLGSPGGAAGICPPGGAGTKPSGTDKFACVMQPASEAGLNRWNFYTYHMDQSGGFGQNILSPAGLHPPQRGVWQCLELMLTVNTPGTANGIIRGWVNGNQVFNRTNMRFRSTTALRINRAALIVYMHQPDVRENTIWWDDIVIATEYIGTGNF